MARRLAVVLGAGASYDSCPADGVLIPGGSVWQPPLVVDLFASGGLDQVLREFHPQAQSIFSHVRTRVRAGLTFEKALEEITNRQNEDVQRLLKYVPVALHDYFTRVSTLYTTDAMNLSHLVLGTVCRGIETAFITVNYDTLLEQSLERILAANFKDEASYVSSPSWKLAKLHGSISWGYAWENDDPGSMQAALASLPLPVRAPNRIEVGLPPDLRANQSIYYPALALPIPGKAEFLCPSSHVEAVEAFLKTCQAVLFIGFSGGDSDVLSLLPRVLPPQLAYFTHFVGGRDAQDVARLINQQVPQLHGAINSNDNTSNGFTSFLDQGFEPFIELLVKHL